MLNPSPPAARRAPTEGGVRSDYRGLVAIKKAMLDFAPTSGCLMSTKPARLTSSSSVRKLRIFTIGAFPMARILLRIGPYGTQDPPRQTVDDTKNPPGSSRR